MSTAAAGIKLLDFGANDPLLSLSQSGQIPGQIHYLRDYLTDLNATTVLEEPVYFDRDYLAEFSAFYAISTRGYQNCCRRLHYFSGPVLTRNRLEAALGGDKNELDSLQTSYLGFVVVRPIPAAPLGHTVLRWYDDTKPQTPRVVAPAQEYEVHIAGITLKMRGLAWQQQDSAVGACATVALWSMMHSSAFDPHHAIPTTADLTRFAHRTASLGARVFPSHGLRIEQILEAIKETGLVPAIVLANSSEPSGLKGFTRERFSSSCAALLRAGYPVLLVGMLEDPTSKALMGQHAVCAVGFRESAASIPPPGESRFQDEGIQHLYLHDDNIGPNVRFEVTGGQAPGSVTRLVRSAPPPVNPGIPSASRALGGYTIVPHSLIIAVHEELRISPDELNRAGLEVADTLCRVLQVVLDPDFSLTLTARFARLPEYLGTMLESTLRGGSGGPAVLAKTRLALCENVPPMSFHIGLVRIGRGGVPLMDILFDTTDNARHLRPIGHVAYQKFIPVVTDALKKSNIADFGVCVDAF